jgi:hypothetical protein
MRTTRTLLFTVALLVAAGAGAAIGATLAQEPQDAAAMAPKPGPEHEILKKDEGKWNAAVKIWMAPNAPPMEVSGTETNKFGCNGLWMMTEFETPDASFTGRGISGWDSHKKKYVSAWVDTESMYFSMSHGTYDKDKKMMTFYGEQPDPESGKMMKTRGTNEYVDANTRRFTSYATPQGAAELKKLEITYTRAK